ncbi:Gamma-tubulin ring protein 91 [Carabus blaptoides fortunei]
MNKNLDELVGVPALLNKLCANFAKNDPDLTASLLKIPLHFLTTSTSFNSSNVDELHIVERIKRNLDQTDSTDKAIKFELLYNRLKKGTILKNRCAILSFLMNLNSGQTDAQPWLILKELKQANMNMRSQSSLQTKESKDSVQKLYSAKINQSETNTQTTCPSIWSDTHIQCLDTSKSTMFSSSISESELIQEVIYSFQGIEGKVLRKEPGSGGFIIDTRAGVSRSQRALVLRLAELGFLHNQVRQHCDDSDRQIGIIGQSLVAALREELTEYYKLIAVLQSQLKSSGCNGSGDLTLRRLLVWVAEPQYRFQWLANIALECQDKKGGALISSVFAFMQHGAPVVQTIARRILKALCTPLLRMLTRWLLDGFLEDPCGEFFIEARPVIKEERLWHDKYHVRSSMLPSFITVAQAKKILVTGKSINFIREICQDLSNLPGREVMQRTFENINAEALFTTELSLELHKILDNAYRETSNRVLDIMRGQNRLVEHMQAFRRYLLLGQGDFIRHLLELLAPELSKSANQIYPHNLSAILDSVVRITNAQFENPDTLKRLDVRLMEVSPGDIGWDVFTVLYHIDGPIGTVFEPTLDTYRTLFGALWKAKRMEFVLSSMWKRQITSSKTCRQLKEVTPVMQIIHILTSEMVHFIHQTQYYFLFEVLECSWAEMLNRVNVAESLDDVIKAHNTFLHSVQCGILVDAESQELYTQLCTIYNTILKLESIEESLYNRTISELKAINVYNTKASSAKLEEGFGITKEDEKKNYDRAAKFTIYLTSIKAQIRSVAKQYNDYVRKYLQMLASHSDINLQLLSVRLDYSGYYEHVENIVLNARTDPSAPIDKMEFSPESTSCNLPQSDSNVTLRSATNPSGYGSVASLIHNSGKKRQKHGI